MAMAEVHEPAHAALVTGGLGAIGSAVARRLQDAGIRVCIVDYGSGEAVPGTTYEACDLGDLAAIDDLSERLASAGWEFDYVIHCAGISQSSSLLKTPRDEWIKVLNVDLIGPMALTQNLIPLLRSDGAVVFVSSGTIFKGTPNHTAYVAAKGGLVAFARTLAREVGDAGIRVNCVAPGLTATPLVNDLEEREPAQIASRALKRSEVVDDVVGVITFLTSPDAKFVTGQTIVVDGGSVMH